MKYSRTPKTPRKNPLKNEVVCSGFEYFNGLLRPVRAVQCKHHEATKTLPPAEIKEEVGKAERSTIPIEHYVIATTAKKSRNAQDTVAELNGRADGDKKFTVELHFWEDICELLGTFPRIQAEFIVGGHDVAADVLASILQDASIASMASRLLSIGGHDSPAGAFSEIEQLLIDRKFDAAQHELDKLTSSSDPSKLAKEDQYQLLRLRGKLALELGAFESASTHFLAAYDLRPDLDQAQHNQVLAYSLVNDSPKAFLLASQYVASGLATPGMLCRLIENAQALQQISEHMSLIEPYLATDENINIALCHRLQYLGNSAGAEEAAGRVIKISPESPHAHFAAALPSHNAAVKGDWRTRQVHLRNALKHYDAALEEVRKHNYTSLLPEVLVNRAAAHMLLGDKEAATADYREAIAVANKPGIYAACAVSFLLHQQDFSSAWELLEFLDQATPEGQFLAAVTEFHNSDDTDERYRYLEQLKQLADGSWSRAVECRWHCVHGALILKDSDFARSCITDAFLDAYPFQALTALAWIALESGQSDVALEFADKALTHTIHDVHSQELRLLAIVFTKLNHHAKALDLLERVAIPGLLNEDTRLLLICAQRLERHDLLLRMCRELRETGEQDDTVRRMEIQLLHRYSPDQGLALVDDFIKASSAPAYFVAFKNVLAIRLNERGRISLEKSRLPTPTELSPSESRLVTLPYVSMGQYDDALLFLHAQLRAYFDEETAHGNYVTYFLTYGDRTSLRSPATKVEAHCAVLLDVDGGAQRWVIIENEAPVRNRGEFSASSEIAQRLIGRAVGDVIELPGLVRTETATIREIQTKYVRSFQDSLQRFRERFPETSFLQEMHLGDGDEFDPEPIIESLKQRREYVQKCIDFYKSNPCPLYLFASRVGISERDAIMALASQPNGIVKCCQTTPSDYERLANEGVATEVIVVDMSAIVTLTLVEGWGYLPSGRRYIVSQATKELVEQWVHTADEERSRETGHASVTEAGDLILQESTPEQREARYAELANIKKMIETHCEYQAAESVAAIEPERRKAYEAVAGFHNVEAMSLVLCLF